MISHKHKVLFYHIPRTAGTTVEIMLTGFDWAYVDLSTKHPSMETFKQKYKNYWDDYKKITIVRNPFSWVKSNYSSSISEVTSFEDYCNDFYFDKGTNDFGVKYCDINKKTFTNIFEIEFDKIYKFEDLVCNNFTILCNDFSLGNVPLNFMSYENNNFYGKPKHTKRTIELIRDKFKEDFINFYPEYLEYDTNKILKEFN